MRKKKSWSPNKYIFASLRRIFRWNPERKKVLKEAERDNGKYACTSCSKQYPRKGVAVDHVSPVVEVSKGFQGWDIYIRRLFCKAGGLQILCKKCHKVKSQQENKERRRIKCLNHERQ